MRRDELLRRDVELLRAEVYRCQQRAVAVDDACRRGDCASARDAVLVIHARLANMERILNPRDDGGWRA